MIPVATGAFALESYACCDGPGEGGATHVSQAIKNHALAWLMLLSKYLKSFQERYA